MERFVRAWLTPVISVFIFLFVFVALPINVLGQTGPPTSSQTCEWCLPGTTPKKWSVVVEGITLKPSYRDADLPPSECSPSSFTKVLSIPIDRVCMWEDMYPILSSVTIYNGQITFRSEAPYLLVIKDGPPGEAVNCSQTIELTAIDQSDGSEACTTSKVTLTPTGGFVEGGPTCWSCHPIKGCIPADLTPGYTFCGELALYDTEEECGICSGETGGSDGQCGNGYIDEGETCEADTDCTSGQCDNCVCAPTGGGICGDGTVNPGEECDDGDTIDGDGCSSTCKNETNDPCDGPFALSPAKRFLARVFPMFIAINPQSDCAEWCCPKNGSGQVCELQNSANGCGGDAFISRNNPNAEFKCKAACAQSCAAVTSDPELCPVNTTCPDDQICAYSGEENCVCITPCADFGPPVGESCSDNDTCEFDMECGVLDQGGCGCKLKRVIENEDDGGFCGDGVRDDDEKCDDGDQDDQNECNNQCRVNFCPCGQRLGNDKTCIDIVCPLPSSPDTLGTRSATHCARKQCVLGGVKGFEACVACAVCYNDPLGDGQRFRDEGARDRVKECFLRCDLVVGEREDVEEAVDIACRADCIREVCPAAGGRNVGGGNGGFGAPPPGGMGGGRTWRE